VRGAAAGFGEVSTGMVATAAAEEAGEEAGVESVHVGVKEGEDGVEGREEDGGLSRGGKGVQGGRGVCHRVVDVGEKGFRLGNCLNRL
jgi:hypothetical protein